MFGKHFEWNENTMHVIEEIGRHMPEAFSSIRRKSRRS